MAESMDATSQ